MQGQIRGLREISGRHILISHDQQQLITTKDGKAPAANGRIEKY